MVGLKPGPYRRRRRIPSDAHQQQVVPLGGVTAAGARPASPNQHRFVTEAAALQLLYGRGQPVVGRPQKQDGVGRGGVPYLSGPNRITLAVQVRIQDRETGASFFHGLLGLLGRGRDR